MFSFFVSKKKYKKTHLFLKSTKKKRKKSMNTDVDNEACYEKI